LEFSLLEWLLGAVAIALLLAVIRTVTARRRAAE
jgi:hypothetical protein